MPKWPRNYKIPEEVYNNNETHNNGKYPISEGNHWHSGIHINFMSGSINTRIYPLIKGELVACRFSNDYINVPRPDEISSKAWESLSQQEQNLYQETGPLKLSYRLKSFLLEEEQYEKYSNSFILLKHYFTIRESGVPGEKKIPFFTLYTNIAPALLDQFKEYDNLSAGKKEIPFYCKYVFCVNPALASDTNTANQKYTIKYYDNTGDGKKILPGSYCTFWENENGTYTLCFDNAPNILIERDTKNDIIPFCDTNVVQGEYFVPFIREETPIIVYDAKILDDITDILDNPDNYADELEKDKLGTLEPNARFSNPITTIGKFYEVKIFPEEISEATKEIEKGMLVLIKQKDLKGRGALKAENSLCNVPINGILVYDKATGGNVRDIIAAEQEFAPLEPWKLICSTKGEYFRIEADVERYIFHEPVQDQKDQDQKEPDPIQVKIVPDTPYAFDETIIPSQPIEINEDMYLGDGYQPPYTNNPHYDVALFFCDKSFLDKQYQSIEGYFMPPMTFYKAGRDNRDNLVFTEREFWYPQIPVKTKYHLKDRDNKIYAEFFCNGEYIYMPYDIVETYKTNLTDWKKFFRILGKAVGAIEEAVNGLDFIENNYDWDNDSNNVGNILNDAFPRWWQEKRGHAKIKSIKRSIICCHPLEWDIEQYIENGRVKGRIVIGYGTDQNAYAQEYFINKVNAIDIWGALKNKPIRDLNTQKNSFWFAHPVYFINHLDKAGLLLEYNSRVQNLKKIQDMVVNLKCLEQGAKGIYQLEPVAGQTYCNHAVYITLLATDGRYENFTGSRTQFPEKQTKEERDEYERVNDIKSSNYWCDILEEQAERGIIRRLVDQDMALTFANMGYTVVVAYKAKDRKKWFPHYATVYPGIPRHPDNGISVANVGSEPNAIKYLIDGFPGIGFYEIKFYLNPNQEFVYKPTEIIKYTDYE